MSSGLAKEAILWMQSLGCEAFLPLILMGNINPPANKCGEPAALVKAYCVSSLKCFTESGLNKQASLNVKKAPEEVERGKVDLLANNRRFNSGRMMVMDKMLLPVDLRPYYVP